MEAQAFITALGPAARAAAKASGVPASVTVAQAALESGWGGSRLYLLARNIFGIKATPDWTGGTLALPTHEVVGGAVVLVDALWRAYPSYGASIADHTAFLTGNRRYAPAFAHQDDAEAFARAVATAGYSTNPRYAETLIQIMRGHNLHSLDAPG